MNFELKYMQRCLQLAEYGAGYVAPNPMVGAVLIANGIIIGEGYHRRYGEAHAEPNAINSVKDKKLLKESTLYVNLEPCSHHGLTPPCANLIVKNKIPKVVIGTLDPNPIVAGRGVEILRNAGIEVIVGVLEQECRELNKRFFIFQEQKRPYILLKWAQTLDGFIDRKRTDANELPLIISNNITKKLTHQMRSENQAILVGTRTVLLDNPSLTVRNWSGKSPIRVAIDRTDQIPSDFKLLDGSISTIIFTEIEKANQPLVEYIKIDFNSDFLNNVLQVLYNRNIHSVMIEGGTQLLTSFIQSGMWDEANIEIAPFEISDGIKAPIICNLPISQKSFEGHQWLQLKNNTANF
ncbi:MAG: bifunctional diaminohydroxyphosphoribosylaminopyrimidine deaminase/5-amino-6-(5-phosphoribosylamino)uracil reductase RibD [Paludibacter sp.]